MTGEVPKKKPGPAAGVAGTPSYSARCDVRFPTLRQKPATSVTKVRAQVMVRGYCLSEDEEDKNGWASPAKCAAANRELIALHHKLTAHCVASNFKSKACDKYEPIGAQVMARGYCLDDDSSTGWASPAECAAANAMRERDEELYRNRNKGSH